MFLINMLALGFIILAVIIICMIVFFVVFGSFRNKKMMNNIVVEITNSLKTRNIDILQMTVSKGLAYDILLSTKSFVYYIKVIRNFGGDEICVNNKYKWQLRQSASDNSLRMVSGIEGLIDFSPQDGTKNIVKKIFVIYPSSSQLLKYINECEMIFIYPNTDVYGCNILTFNMLRESPDSFVPTIKEQKGTTEFNK